MIHAGKKLGLLSTNPDKVYHYAIDYKVGSCQSEVTGPKFINDFSDDTQIFGNYTK